MVVVAVVGGAVAVVVGADVVDEVVVAVVDVDVGDEEADGAPSLQEAKKRATAAATISPRCMPRASLAATAKRSAAGRAGSPLPQRAATLGPFRPSKPTQPAGTPNRLPEPGGGLVQVETPSLRPPT
jgi:hypothetical protein